jgi:hypothetical protein
MFIEYIKSWIYEKELIKEVRYNSNNEGLIGIIMDYTNINKEYEDVVKILIQNGIKKEKIVFITFLNAKGPATSEIPVFTKDQIHWSGYPKSENINNFIKNKYKAVYYLASNFEKPYKFILAKTKSDFKAGIYYKGIEEFLDFTLDTKYTSSSELLREILQTITKLKEKR